MGSVKDGMAVQILLLVAGFAALIKGADLFVSGSADLARRFRVPSLMIGLTIVALGTSAPELAVSVSAALQGSNEIALSNIVGSNIFNLLGVLGVCAILHPLPVERAVLKRDFPFTIAATVLILFLTYGMSLVRGRAVTDMAQEAGVISRPVALLLLGLFAGYMTVLILNARKHPSPPEEAKKNVPQCALLILLGLVLIIGGGQAVVNSAKEIARAAGMTETLIGLTVVAVGTSLPELVTSAVAARKGEAGLAIGNAVGSNTFNLLLILGLSALIHPIAVNMASVLDLALLLVISVIAYIFSFTGRSIARAEGIVMVLLYIGDVVFAILR